MGRRVIAGFLTGVLVAALLGSAALAKATPQVELEGERSMYFLESTSAYGAGGEDVFLMYADAETYTGWARTWGRPATEYPKGLAVDTAGNAIVCGDYGMVRQEEYAAQGGFVVKFTPTGEVAWARDLGWSYFVVFLEDVTTDPANNIYLTGMAWTYDEVPEPDGYYPVEGFIFTVKLDPGGDITWAKRWNVDERDWISGRAIITDGSEVVVAGEYTHRPSEDQFSDDYLQMLWYDAATGNLITSQAWGMAGDRIYPTCLEYGPSNYIYVGGEYGFNSESDALLVSYSPGRVWQFSQIWGDTGYDRLNDLAVLDSTLWGVGSHQVGKRPPQEGSSYEAPIYDGLTLTWDKGVFLGAQKTHDLMNDDLWFSSMDVRSYAEAWTAGRGGLGYGDQGYSPASGVNFYLSGEIVYPTPREDESCGASALLINNATVTTPFDLSQIRNFMFSENIYLSRINWVDKPHIPDVILKASATSGSAPATISFDASESFVVNGSIAKFEWTFDFMKDLGYPNDGGTTGLAQHTFDQPGSYMVTVLVTSDDGSTMSQSINIDIQ